MLLGLIGCLFAACLIDLLVDLGHEAFTTPHGRKTS